MVIYAVMCGGKGILNPNDRSPLVPHSVRMPRQRLKKGCRYFLQDPQALSNPLTSIGVPFGRFYQPALTRHPSPAFTEKRARNAPG